MLRLWTQSEYFPAWERLLEDALEDASHRVLLTNVQSQDHVYALLEAHGRYMGLKDAQNALLARITAGVKARERLRGHP